MASETVAVEEAAEILKTHPERVYGLISSGELPAARFGRRYVMMRSDVLALLERRINSETAQRRRRMVLMPDLLPGVTNITDEMADRLALAMGIDPSKRPKRRGRTRRP